MLDLIKKEGSRASDDHQDPDIDIYKSFLSMNKDVIRHMSKYEPVKIGIIVEEIDNQNVSRMDPNTQN